MTNEQTNNNEDRSAQAPKRKRPMGRWWRAYDDALNDPKLQRLSADLFRCWFNLMCLTSKNNGQLPLLEEMAFALRLTPARMDRMLKELIRCGLIELMKYGGLAPHNWQARQYASDLSTQRVRDHRKRFRNVKETSPDTDTDTDTDKKDKDIEVADKGGKNRKGMRLPEDWRLTPEDERYARDLFRGSHERVGQEFENFVDYWLAKAGQGAVKLDWSRTWRRWCRTAAERQTNGTNRQYPTRPPTSKERYGELLRSVRSNGLREFITGVVSEPSSSRPGSVSHADSGGNGQIPVRASQTGNPTDGNPNGPPDLLTQRGLRQHLAGPKIQHPAANSTKTHIITDSYTDD